MDRDPALMWICDECDLPQSASSHASGFREISTSEAIIKMLSKGKSKTPEDIAEALNIPYTKRVPITRTGNESQPDRDRLRTQHGHDHESLDWQCNHYGHFLAPRQNRNLAA